MKKGFLVILLLSVSITCISQNTLLFSNQTTKKEIKVECGDLVKFSYKGYLEQPEVKSGIVMSVSDSVVEIVAPVSGGRLSLGATETRYIIVKDITGFRKFHRSRPFLMTLSNLTITVGVIVLFYNIDKETDLSFGEKFGLSLGTGLASTLIVRGMFPERIKNKIGKDWTVSVLK